MKPAKHILPIIVFAQFCGTSLWFSGNAVMADLANTFNLAENSLGHLTAAVQLGFIAGTLIFAVLSIADRFSPSAVVVVSACLGALFNGCVIWDGNSLFTLLLFRFLTGFCLAGIYPIGMKIAADYYDRGLGRSLGFLVGALVLGTAFPHLLRDVMNRFPWRQVVVSTSAVAIFGGTLLVITVPNGPHRKTGSALRLGALAEIFKNKKLRHAAIGYFGHMWELYAFWAFVPLMLSTYVSMHPETHISMSLWSFIIIGAGAFACVLGGFISERQGVGRIARYALFLSMLCCILSPLFFMQSSSFVMVAYLCFWGMVVIADSPLFSTLVAQHAEARIKGTAITLVTCIGFAITIGSIQLLHFVQSVYSLYIVLPILALGPIIGLWVLRNSKD